jgi:hypothetical protein
MRSRLVALTCSALIAAGALSACGGSSDNGVASKSPEAIVSAALNAMSSVKSVRVSGAVTNGTSQIGLNLDLVAGQGGRGQMSQSGLSFQIVAVDQFVYISAGAPFWLHFGGAAAAQLLQGRWLKAPATGNFASFAALTNLQQLLKALLTNHGTLAKGTTTTVDGVKVIAVNDTTRGGTLYVATTGNPYPIEVVKGGAQTGRLVFDHFNESVPLAAPANSIDVSQLRAK